MRIFFRGGLLNLVYPNLIKPFDIGWNLFIRPTMNQHIKISLATFNAAKSLVHDTFRLLDVILSWLIILAVNFIEDIIVYWLYHLPWQAGTLLIHIGVIISYLESVI